MGCARGERPYEATTSPTGQAPAGPNVHGLLLEWLVYWHSVACGLTLLCGQFVRDPSRRLRLFPVPGAVALVVVVGVASPFGRVSLVLRFALAGINELAARIGDATLQAT